MSGHPADERDGGGEAEEERPLAHHRRRHLLYCLYLYATPVKLADVAEQVLVWETGDEPGDYLRERLYVYNDLYHEHLPVLCEAGLVEYDQREDVVGPGPALDRYEPALERHLSAELDDPLHAEHDVIEESAPGPFPEGLYGVLAMPDRRRALHYLLDRARVSLDELTDVLAGWRATDGGPVEPEVRERIRTALERSHVPLLEEVGLVAHDADEDTVRLLPLTDPVREVVRSAVPSGPDRSYPPAAVRGRDESGDGQACR